MKWVIIGSGNGFLPTQRQAIICTNDDFQLIWTLRKNVSETHWNQNAIIFLKNLWLKMSYAKRRPFWLDQCVDW